MHAGLREVVAGSAWPDQQHSRVAGGADDRENSQAEEEETDGTVADATQNESEHQAVRRTSSHGPV